MCAFLPYRVLTGKGSFGSDSGHSPTNRSSAFSQNGRNYNHIRVPSFILSGAPVTPRSPSR
jgi:hypothetical protein